ncbi:hypothetical protein B4U80_07690 [Leptotrombidium deliense]|uniref:Uncharacterized protein n=1 Tax=Leptotrombidium deliense TaxID=299467 RepID=A0A443RTX1_9ACAR|nr:hypothetical protein B4U80_07690 [Leptotrombidium deliense]
MTAKRIGKIFINKKRGIIVIFFKYHYLLILLLLELISFIFLLILLVLEGAFGLSILINNSRTAVYKKYQIVGLEKLEEKFYKLSFETLRGVKKAEIGMNLCFAPQISEH